MGGLYGVVAGLERAALPTAAAWRAAEWRGLGAELGECVCVRRRAVVNAAEWTSIVFGSACGGLLVGFICGVLATERARRGRW